MEQNIQMKVEKLNKLYHQIINKRADFVEQEEFKSLVNEVKREGYRFRVGMPNVDFTTYDLNTNETKLFIRLEVIRLIKLDAISEKLFWFATYMRDAEKHLARAIYVSLCKREIIDEQYFLPVKKKRIDFIQSGHAIDIYPLFNLPTELSK